MPAREVYARTAGFIHRTGVMCRLTPGIRAVKHKESRIPTRGDYIAVS